MLNLYFKSIKVVDAHNVPNTSPLLVVANHPASALDPMVIATKIKRNLKFISRGDLTLKPFWAWLYKSLNMVPVYRPHDTPELMHKNKGMFSGCIGQLANGQSIMIFPEGYTVTERRLRPIKTGAARIALNAEEEHEFGLGLEILPIGLTYSNPRSIRSKVLINVGETIKVADYRSAYAYDPRETVRQLTADIKMKLEELSVVVSEDNDELLTDVEELLAPELQEDYEFSKAEAAELAISQDIVHAIDVIEKEEPQLFSKIKSSLAGYFSMLRKLNINDKELQPSMRENGGISRASLYARTIACFLQILVGFPIWLYGVANNYLPFIIPILSARRISKRKAHYGTIYMVLGSVTFTVFYIIQVALCAWLVGIWWIVLLYAISLPITGLYAHMYNIKWSKFVRLLNLTRLSLKNSKGLTDLIAKREALLNALELAKAQYLNTLMKSF